ncbi:MAG: ribosome silencing factor [Bacteroidales bacterium]|nr:ribosome silencing factor [Bacteroidales bacterium]
MPLKKESTSKEAKTKKVVSSEISIDKTTKTVKKAAPKKLAVRKPAAKKEVSTETVVKKVAARKPAVKKTITTEAPLKKVVSKKTAVKTPDTKQIVAKQTVVKEIDQIELRCIADAILDKKGSYVCSLNLSAIGTAICDYFVICNADSRPQVMAIADNIEEMMIKKCKRKVLRMQGKENAFWIILDYANIVVHVFQTEYRQFYRIEDLWADAEKTIYQE